MSRRDDALRLAELVGPEGLVIDDPADGWPALGRVVGLDQPIEVALYVAPVGFSHRNRDDIERRFQNPGKERPILPVPDRDLVYIGIWEGDDPDAPLSPPVLVTADAERRIGRMTRASVFPRLESLLIAHATGVHIGQTTTGEEIAAFVPMLFAAQIHAQVNEVTPDETRYRGAMVIAPGESPPERQRRVSMTLARANRFARDVRDVYAGRCAMCGLGLSLVESAHILPVAAPASVDEVRNGVALCPNHHRAFDRHLVWIDPATLEIRIHPDTITSSTMPSEQVFVGSTFDHLAVPEDPTQHPHPPFLRARYRHFGDDYAWATA